MIKLSTPIFTVNANNDPTKTLTLRTKFANDVSGRFNKVRASVNNYVKNIEENGFIFETDVQKLEQFNIWLQQQIDTDILAVSDLTPWTDEYIQKGYQSGTKHGLNELGKAGYNDLLTIEQSLALPVNRESLQLLYTRTYVGLEGITTSMATQMSRILAEGFANGTNPNDIARTMSNSIDKINRTRAKVLARTEIINAHANATLNNYELAGVEEVNVIPEWLTAGDSRVCPICKALSQQSYTLESAKGMIPAHPNCRCAWTPKVVRDK